MENKIVEFTVNDDPVGKARARVYTHYRVSNGRFRRYVNSVTPDKTVKFEDKVHAAGLKSRKKLYKEPLSCYLRVEIVSYRSLNESWSKKKKFEAVNGIIRPDTKPDCDNIAKAVLDGMNTVKRKGKVGVYLDDKQVIELEIKQFYAIKPKVIVKVIPLSLVYPELNSTVVRKKGKYMINRSNQDER